jgi:hypothetical protein
MGAFFKQDILEDLTLWTPEKGSPQGAVISPLLANLYLHPVNVVMLRTPGYLCVADLDSDQGELHDDSTGVFHPGFERVALREAFVHDGFSQVKDVTAVKVVKPTCIGDLRKFSVFLMTGEKHGTMVFLIRFRQWTAAAEPRILVGFAAIFGFRKRAEPFCWA